MTLPLGHLARPRPAAASILVLIWTLTHTAGAQTPPRPSRPPPPPSDSAVELDAVDVVASKDYAHQIGAVVGNITPELQLGQADIRSFGVSTVTELLSELAPEIRSDRGRGGGSPVVLMNGRRVSSFTEVANIPTEAIQRVDILPEETALKYGYAADQKVVNIVLRRRFRATTAEVEAGAPTEGGEALAQSQIDRLTIRRDDRLQLDLKYALADGLTEADRGLAQPSAPTVINPTDIDAARSLIPRTQSLNLNGVWAHPLPWGVNATLNGAFGVNGADSLRGLQIGALTVPSADPFAQSAQATTINRYVGSPLRQFTGGWTAHLGGALNKDLRAWRLSFTSAWDHADSQTDTDQGLDLTGVQAALNALSPAVDPYGVLAAALTPPRPQAHARSITDTANAQIQLNGPLLNLPAGAVYSSAKIGDTGLAQAATSVRGGLVTHTTLNRNDFNIQGNLDLPLTSRKRGFLGAAGELSLFVNGAFDQLSDYGALKAFGFGLNWTPAPGWTLLVSRTEDQAAPSVQQLGGATIFTPGVPVFDFVTGRTVTVTTVSGGNPALRADDRHVLKIGLTVKPFPARDLTLTANYIRSRMRNPALTFPGATAALQSAFPSRFLRNAAGDLVEDDLRPVNFASVDREQLRWGVNFTRPFGKPPSEAERRALYEAFRAINHGGQSGGDFRSAGGGGGPPGGGPSGAGFGGGGFRGGAFGGRTPPATGRMQFALYHTLYFVDREVIGPSAPALDLLRGAPIGQAGGQYRNEVEAQLGASQRGWGARLSATWREGTRVTAAGGATPGDLTFSDLTTVNFRLFDNLGQHLSLMKQHPWLLGARVSLIANNLLDQRIRVRDPAGATPLAYQPPYLDATGRTVQIEFRKLFF